MDGAEKGTRLAGIAAVAVLLCVCANMAEGRGRRGRRLRRARPSVPPVRPIPAGPVVALWRKGITDYRRVVEAFKKNARFKVVHRPLEGAGRRADATSANSIKKLNPRLVLTVGGRASSLLKHFPTASAVRVYAPIESHRDRTESVFFKPGPSDVVPALRKLRPGLKRLVIVTCDDNTRRAKQYSNVAVKAGVRTRMVAASDPGKLIWALNQVKLSRSDGVLLVPDPRVVTPLLLKAVLRIQHRRGVPVLSFSRRHVARGLLMAAHLDPDSCGQAAAVMAANLLRSQGARGETDSRRERRRPRRRRKGGPSPVEPPEPKKPEPPQVKVHWWYNPAAARLLGIGADRFRALKARPVGGEKGTSR